MVFDLLGLYERMCEDDRFVCLSSLVMPLSKPAWLKKNPKIALPIAGVFVFCPFKPPEMPTPSVVKSALHLLRTRMFRHSPPLKTLTYTQKSSWYIMSFSFLLSCQSRFSEAVLL